MDVNIECQKSDNLGNLSRYCRSDIEISPRQETTKVWIEKIKRCTPSTLKGGELLIGGVTC